MAQPLATGGRAAGPCTYVHERARRRRCLAERNKRHSDVVLRTSVKDSAMMRLPSWLDHLGPADAGLQCTLGASANNFINDPQE